MQSFQFYYHNADRFMKSFHGDFIRDFLQLPQSDIYLERDKRKKLCTSDFAIRTETSGTEELSAKLEKNDEILFW